MSSATSLDKVVIRVSGYAVEDEVALVSKVLHMYHRYAESQGLNVQLNPKGERMLTDRGRKLPPRSPAKAYIGSSDLRAEFTEYSGCHQLKSKGAS
jgi:hypothetical protein